MAIGKRIRKGVTALTAAAFAVSGVLLTAPAAHAEEASAAPTLEVEISEVPAEKIVVAANGAHYDEAAATTGEVRLSIVEKGGTPSAENSVVAPVAADGRLETASAPFVRAVADLDEAAQYEVVSWASDAAPTAQSVYARADAVIDWNQLIPKAAEAGSSEETETVQDGQSESSSPAAPDADSQQKQRSAAAPESRATTNELFPVQGEGKRIRVNVSEVPDERVEFMITGSGFEDVRALPGQTEPHVYFKLHEKGVPLDGVQQDDTAISAIVDSEGRVEDVLSVPAADLDREKSYEIISWPSRWNPTEANLYTRADVEIDWHELFPADAPRITEAKVSSADSKSGLTVDVAAENITFSEGENVSGVTIAMIERGKKPARPGDTVVNKHISAVDGKLEVTLQAPKSRLDRYTNYDVAVYRDADFRSQIASGRLSISAANWTKVFGKALPATVTVNKVSVAKTGLNVNVSAKNLPGSDIYVAVIERGKESELSQDGGYLESGFLYQPPVKNGRGNFAFTLSKHDLDRKKKYEVLIWKSHSEPNAATIYGRADIDITERQWDALANTKPAEKKTNKPKPASRNGTAQAGSLTWGISSGFADYTTNKKRPGGKSGGKIITDGVGGGRGGYVFPQAVGGSWNKKSQTGTVRYSGVVTFTAHHGLMRESFANPVITVTSATSGSISVGGRSFALNLGSASKSVGANGEVTWSNVPVAGSISGGGGGGGGSIAVDPLSFTVGSPSGVRFGSTQDGDDKKKYTPAATPPTTEGLEVLTPEEKLVPGGRIEIQAQGFEADDEGILVVLYSDPIVLDDTAKADENGLVRWSGTLPKDVELGEHVLTLQGSSDAGAVIEIVEKNKRATQTTAEAATAEPQAAVAGIVPLGRDGMPLWEWWAGAIALVAIAGCTTVLAIRQRRLG